MQSNHKMPLRNQSLPPNANAAGSTEDLNAADRVTFRGGHSSNMSQDPSTNSTNEQENNAQISVDNDEDAPITQPIAPIHSKTKNWYSNYCNRWASLFGAILKIVIMMLVNTYYGATCIGVVFLVWFYVGTANPAVKPGLAAEFRLIVWLKGLVFRCFG